MLRSPEPTPRSRPKRPRVSPGPYLVLFLVSLALRLLYVWATQGPHATPVSDSLQIDKVAWNLARGAGFSFDGANGPYPTGIVPPVVPWVTSLLYRVTGHWYFGAGPQVGGFSPLASRSASQSRNLSIPFSPSR